MAVSPEVAESPEGVWSLTTALPDWLRIPGPTEDVDSWRATAAGIFELFADVSGEENGSPSAGQTPSAEPTPAADLYRDSIDSLLQFAAAIDSDQMLVAGLSVAGRFAVPVLVEVVGADNRIADLVEAAGGSGGMSVGVESVEPLPESSGTGIRHTRFDLDDEGSLWVSVRCIRRDPLADTIVLWRSREIELLAGFAPRLDELLQGVEFRAVESMDSVRTDVAA